MQTTRPHEQPIRATGYQELIKSLSKLERRNKIEAAQEMDPNTFKIKLAEVIVLTSKGPPEKFVVTYIKYCYVQCG